MTTPLAAYTLPEAHEALAALVRDWLPRQRWFQGKARTVTDVRVADVAGLDERIVDAFVDVAYADGGTERYHVPLAAAVEHDVTDGVVARHGELVLIDATYDAEACRLLATACLDARVITSAHGARLVGRPVFETHLDPENTPQRLSVEQSNTSVLFGDRWMLKLFRRLQPGVNPDIEITRGLSLAGFAHTPAQQGAWELEEGEQVTALAVLADFVPGAQEGWTLATRDAAAVARGTPADDTTLHASAPELGAAVGAMHVALAEAFDTAEATADDSARWVDAMTQQLERVLAVGQERAPDLVAPLVQRRDDVAERFATIAKISDGGLLVRTHGDLHLGQVLLAATKTWQILDFEGEPARTLEERRALHSPLRDVAGMLRSFDYAAAHSGTAASVAASEARADGGIPQAVAAWRDATRERFCQGYLRIARPAGLLPADEHDLRALLDAFELDKAVYELGYELANRPDWIAIPVGGILRVLTRAGDGDGGRT